MEYKPQQLQEQNAEKDENGLYYQTSTIAISTLLHTLRSFKLLSNLDSTGYFLLLWDLLGANKTVQQGIKQPKYTQ